MITPDKGVVIAERYTLVRPLAHGGMGSVWIARHRELEIDVTIKFMAPSLIASVEARGRFEREARAAARLKSQHVVHVHDYGVEDGTPYIAMELLSGESLWTRLAREGRLPLPATARLVVQVCKALRTAHEAGLVHRDLKPGNIFLARKDDDEVVTVLDFGIAKALAIGDAQAHTESGVLLGSVHYMSPEQARGSRKVDHRSDLWSLGVILYRMLGGRLPFPGESLGDVLVRVCTAPFPPLSSIAPDLPERLDEFFARSLDRNADQRFQSAQEMAEAFSAMALGMPLQPSSRPPARLTPTVPISQPAAPRAAFAGEPLRDPTTHRIPEPQPSSRPALDSSAEQPTYAVSPAYETSTGPLPAMLVPHPRVELSSEIVRLPGGDAQARARAWWPVLAVAVAVALAVLLGVKLRSEATSSNGAPHATATASAAPSVVAPLAPVSTVSTAPMPSPTVDAPPRAASAMPSIAAPAPALPHEHAGPAVTAPHPRAKPQVAAPPTSEPATLPATGPMENHL